MNDRTLAGIILGYVFGFILTFGHAYHSVPDTQIERMGGMEYTVHNTPGFKAVGAFLSSMGWPLYWSVKAWQ